MMQQDNGCVLIVDDEPNAVKVLSAILKAENYQVLEAKDANQAMKTIASSNIDVIITDVKMPGMDGLQFFDHMNNSNPDIPVIFLTAYGSVKSAVHVVTKGAFYYFIKPPDYRELKNVLAKAVKQRRLKNELTSIENGGEKAKPLIGNSPGMLRIFDTLNAVKDSESSVLIYGETGTGKELAARLLHFNSNRRDKPFIAVNCAAIPRELMESELFGFERGAFTGASSRRTGRFEESSGGTMFLDEIGELELSLQAKLLRVLQEKEIERLGSNRKIPVDFRLISSTNRDLQAEIHAGNFREDLYYRINVVAVQVPPLRERGDDIQVLVEDFVKEFCAREKKLLSVSSEVMGALIEYQWPGNVRQLRNVIERAVLLAKGRQITLKDLPEELVSRKPNRSQDRSVKTLREIELETVLSVIEECRGNKSKAAEMLGISRKALYNKLKAHP